MSKNKFFTPVMEKDAFLSIFNEGNVVGSAEDVNDAASNASGMRKLWRSVLAQAFIDALSNSSKAMLKREKERATAWLLGKSEEFYTVCSLADTDAELVYHHAKRLFAKIEVKPDISKNQTGLEKKSWLPRTDVAFSWSTAEFHAAALVAA